MGRRRGRFPRRSGYGVRCSHRCSCCGQRCKLSDCWGGHEYGHQYYDESHTGEPKQEELSAVFRSGPCVWAAVVKIGDESVSVHRNGKPYASGRWEPGRTAVSVVVDGVPPYILMHLAADLWKQMSHVDGTLRHE